MPRLDWIGKDKVINHHQDVAFKTLEHGYGFDAVRGKTAQATNSGNKIIHGDNLEALKALLPEYEGRAKCIYIDSILYSILWTIFEDYLPRLVRFATGRV